MNEWLEAIGAAIISAGAAVIYMPAGLIIAGGFVFAAGFFGGDR